MTRMMLVFERFARCSSLLYIWFICLSRLNFWQLLSFTATARGAAWRDSTSLVQISIVFRDRRLPTNKLMWTCCFPTQPHPRGGHPSHSNLVRGKLTSPTPNPAGDGTSGLTSYPRRRSKVSEAACLRPQRSAPARTRTRAVRPRVQRSDHWTTHASPK